MVFNAFSACSPYSLRTAQHKTPCSVHPSPHTRIVLYPCAYTFAQPDGGIATGDNNKGTNSTPVPLTFFDKVTLPMVSRLHLLGELCAPMQ